MLIYLATYPRCGSGVLRRLIRMCLEEPVSNGYDIGSIRAAPTDDPAIMHSKIRQPGRRDFLMVREPALATLTPQVRERLGAMSRPFFVKTHELPFDEWMPGERAVQMVRHPAACLLSFSELTQVSLDEHIDGRHPPSGWADYHRAWRGVEIPIARVRYEDNFDRPNGAITAIERMAVQPVLYRKFETSAEASARNPERNPGRGNFGWKETLTPEQIDRIWERHGDEAARHGYSRDGLAG